MNRKKQKRLGQVLNQYASQTNDYDSEFDRELECAESEF